MKKLSSGFHLAMGLASIVVGVLLLAMMAGVVPTHEKVLRQERVSLAESIAVAATALIDAEDEARLAVMLRTLAERNPQIGSLGVRRADGAVVVTTGAHDSAEAWTSAEPSTASHVRVPLMRDGTAWGQVELQFQPRSIFERLGGGALITSLVVAGIGASCTLLFHFYLRRMLRHLDPSKVIPGRVRTAFDTLTEGLLVLDPKGRVVLANRAFAELLAVDPDALVGREIDALGWTRAPAAEAQEEVSPWQALLADGRARRDVLMYLEDAQQRRHTFMVNCSAVPGAGGKPAGVLVSLDDVTALEEQEIQLRIARDAAEQANQAKSDFLANMSHEIRTPMNAILGFTELLRRGWHQQDPVAASRHLDTILGSGRHLLALINDILDLSKVEAGHLEVDPIPTAAHALVHEVVQVLGVRAREKNLSLTVEFRHRLPAQLMTDPQRLRQIITNLVGNALKFTSEGGVTIVVDASEAARELQLDIIDTGIGIPQDKLESIFEPFVQAESSTSRKFGGTGLGLSISRKFARALGGNLTATSEPGRGSTFHVRLPLQPVEGAAWLSVQALQQAGIATAEALDEDGARWHFPARHVLVVDDGDENRELVRLVLESVGLIVGEARNGQEALDAVQKLSFDLVLMDVQMPVMDGYTATRMLRQRQWLRPVLALTANAMKGYEAQIDQAGFTGHLTKPLDIDELLRVLAEHLGGRRVAAGESAPVGPARLAQDLAVAAEAIGALAGPEGVPDSVAAAVSQAAADVAPLSAAPAAASSSQAPTAGAMASTAGQTSSAAGSAAPAAPASQTATTAAAAPAPAGNATGTAEPDGAPIVSRLAGHPRLAAVVRNFALTLPGKLDQMQAALDAGDVTQLRELVHWLKGAGGTVGYDALFEPSVSFEQRILAGESAAWPADLARLRALAARLQVPDAPTGATRRADPPAPSSQSAAPSPAASHAAAPSSDPNTPPGTGGCAP